MKPYYVIYSTATMSYMRSEFSTPKSMNSFIKMVNEMKSWKVLGYGETDAI